MTTLNFVELAKLIDLHNNGNVFIADTFGNKHSISHVQYAENNDGTCDLVLCQALEPSGSVAPDATVIQLALAYIEYDKGFVECEEFDVDTYLALQKRTYNALLAVKKLYDSWQDFDDLMAYSFAIPDPCRDRDGITTPNTQTMSTIPKPNPQQLAEDLFDALNEQVYFANIHTEAVQRLCSFNQIKTDHLHETIHRVICNMETISSQLRSLIS